MLTITPWDLLVKDADGANGVSCPGESVSFTQLSIEKCKICKFLALVASKVVFGVEKQEGSSGI